MNKDFYKNIHGFFDFEDVYEYMVKNANDNSHFVEVGAWLGRSTAFMADQIIKSGKRIKFDVVDTWKGSPFPNEMIGYKPIFDFYKIDDMYEIFMQNMKGCEVDQYITPVRMESVEAAKNYQNESLDFVFIDACHDYDYVKADILAWLPKIKPGRVLAGHDYGLWQGVTMAVNEFLGNAHYKLHIVKHCWMHTKYS